MRLLAESEGFVELGKAPDINNPSELGGSTALYL